MILLSGAYYIGKCCNLRETVTFIGAKKDLRVQNDWFTNHFHHPSYIYGLTSRHSDMLDILFRAEKTHILEQFGKKICRFVLRKAISHLYFFTKKKSSIK